MATTLAATPTHDEITWPKITYMPTFTDEQIWRYVGERGVYSERPEYLKHCFDVFFHKEGMLIYRMKPEHSFPKAVRPSKKSKKSEDDGPRAELFGGVVFHDPMEAFILREYQYDGVDQLTIMNTHDVEGNPHEELENWCSVPFDQFYELMKREDGPTIKEKVREYLATKRQK